MVELASLNMVELASLNMVELASLNMVVDRLEHGLSWPAWTVLLTGLFMYVGTYCSLLDERTDLNNVVIIINQQPCSYREKCCSYYRALSNLNHTCINRSVRTS